MNQCLLCGAAIENDVSLSFLLSFQAYQSRIICVKCQNQFELIDPGQCCQFCGKAGAFDDLKCSDCQGWLNSSTAKFRNRSLYQYNSKMQEYMHRYKFQGDYRLRKVFQAEVVERVKRFKRLVIPIPLHPSTYQNRGFNQVKGLLGSLKFVDVLRTIDLNRTNAQSTKDRRHRLSMRQPFKTVPEKLDQIIGQDLLVVDDVYTTGTTIRYAAQLLQKVGAHSVNGMTLAH